MQEHFPINPSTGLEDNTLLPWKNGDPSTGTEGSYPPYEVCTNPQAELINLITAAGLTPADADLYQSAKAVQSGALNYAADTGTADALVAAYSPAITSYGSGLILRVKKGANPNATTTPTFDAGAGAKTVVRRDASALAAGDLPGSGLFTLMYDAAITKWRVIGFVASDLIPAIASTGKVLQLNYFELVSAGSQNIASSVVTAVTDFSVSGSQPSDASHAAGVITIGQKTAGVWSVNAFFDPSQTTGAPTVTQVYVYKNGVATAVNQTVSGTFVTAAGAIRVANGDLLTMRVWQNSGHNQTCVGPGTPAASFFNLYQISG